MVLEGGVKRQWLGYEGGAIMNGISVPRKGSQELPCPFHHSKKSTVCNPEEGLRQNPAMLVPWFWVSGLQNCEKGISVVYNPPSLLELPEWTKTINLHPSPLRDPHLLKTPMPTPSPGDPPAQAPGWWAVWAAVAESADVAGTLNDPWKSVKMLESGNLLAPGVPRD